VRGCVILRPYGYKIWELIQEELNKRFSATGHENIYMPMFIPEKLLQKEKEHVEGFAPEVAWVTHGGDEKLVEKLCVRPTSEVLFCEHYKNIIKSYRDLPKLYNQWCSVVRWEKTTRPFLRSLEFLWQEGHTAHASFQEAQQEALSMLDIYKNFCEKILSVPVIKGQKTKHEKFAGALYTYTIESLMHDGRALQTGTTHNFSDNFSKAFDIKFLDQDNNLKHVFQTSWGLSTRLIGALIMVHGDNNGLVLPPEVAPVQIIIVPVKTQDNLVIQKALELENKLREKNLRVKLDLSDKTPGWKFSEYEMRGVPLRIEIGPRDIKNNCLSIHRRDTQEKNIISCENFEPEKILKDIQDNLFLKASLNLTKNIFEANNLEEIKNIFSKQLGFIKTNWCGNLECELKLKEITNATIRCVDLEEYKFKNQKCFCCDKPANQKIYCAKSY